MANPRLSNLYRANSAHQFAFGMVTIAYDRPLSCDFIDHYNHIRLHSAIGYIAPMDRLAGRHHIIFAARDKKLETAREARRIKRQLLTN